MRTAIRVSVTLLLIMSAAGAFLLTSLNDRYLPPPLRQLSQAARAQTTLVVGRAFRVVHGGADVASPTPGSTPGPTGTPRSSPADTPTEAPTATREVPTLPTMVIPEGTLKASTATPTVTPVPTDKPKSGAGGQIG